MAILDDLQADMNLSANLLGRGEEGEKNYDYTYPLAKSFILLESLKRTD